MRFHLLFRYFLLLFLILFTIFFIAHFLFDDIQKSTKTERFAVARTKSFRHLDVTVVMIVSDVATAEKEYSTAVSTIRCYCRMHNYKLRIIEDVDYSKVCKQADFMFRRHCIVAEMLLDTEWIFFLDADVAIVNPNLLLEDYIDTSFDITFYDRFVNWEVAAGSYIVRNTPWAVKFLKKFANFESQLPDSFHGTDNGALHVFLQQTFYPQLSDESRICLKIWETADSFDDLFTFEACIRSVMGDVHEFGKARILKKGTGWVRDIWLTDSKWSPDRDFMLHGLKEAHRVHVQRGIIVNGIFGQFNWRSPLSAPLLHINNCISLENSNWKYDNRLIVSSIVVEDYLTKRFAEVERRKWQSLAAVSGYI